MNPIGIAMAFLLFWGMIGLGLFLMANSVVKLSRGNGSLGATAQTVTAGMTQITIEKIVSLALLVVGAALTWVGASSLYVVIYQ